HGRGRGRGRGAVARRGVDPVEGGRGGIDRGQVLFDRGEQHQLVGSGSVVTRRLVPRRLVSSHPVGGHPVGGKPVATDGLRGNRSSRGPGVRTVGSVGGDRIGLHGVGA